MKRIVTLMLMLACMQGFSQTTATKDDHTYHLEAQKIKSSTTAPLDTITADTIKYWTYGGDIILNVSQVALKNWAAGGNSSVAGNMVGNLFTRYERKHFVWDAKLSISYGMQKQGKLPFRKSDDVIDLTSQLGYKFNKSWKMALLKNFKSQFANGFEYDDVLGTRSRVSSFMSPAYVIVALGIEYEAPKYFKLFVSPITSKSVIVLADEVPETKYGVDSGEHVFQNVGAYLVANFDAEVFKNVTLSTKLELFSNYLQNPQNIDINWGVKINMKVNEFLTVSLGTDLIYDDDVMVPKTREDGTVYQGKGTQFRENLAIGVGYKFGRDNKK